MHIIVLKGSESLTLYADVLLAINFSMDFLALFITSIILHKKTSKSRIVLSALLGALFGVFEVILPLGTVSTTILSVLVSFFMCAIAFFEKSIKRFFFTIITFWIISMALAGVMSFVYTVMNRVLSSVIVGFSPVTTYNGARFFIIVSITAIVGIIFSKIFTTKKDVKFAEIKVTIDKDEYIIKALCDSGNMLTEPISAKPVILVCEKTTLGKRILDIDDKRKRFIPYSDVTSDGILLGIIPEKVYVEKNSVDAVVATIKKDSFADYDGLVPSSLI